jgi:hypothetical protein
MTTPLTTAIEANGELLMSTFEAPIEGLWMVEGGWLYKPDGNPLAEGVPQTGGRAAKEALMADLAATLNAASALLNKIEDNPTLFFGMEDTCQDEFDDLRSLLAKARGEA